MASITTNTDQVQAGLNRQWYQPHLLYENENLRAQVLLYSYLSGFLINKCIRTDDVIWNIHYVHLYVFHYVNSFLSWCRNKCFLPANSSRASLWNDHASVVTVHFTQPSASQSDCTYFYCHVKIILFYKRNQGNQADVLPDGADSSPALRTEM